MRISDWSSDVCSSDLTSASRVTLSKAALAQRPLLCLYGLGTNAGLKRVAGATPDVSYEELLHVHRRFIHAPARSEERRVGKECVSTCRYRWSPYTYKKK